jgi:UDP-N-acetylmuramate dehydrogenase
LYKKEESYILGGGSNILFTGDFNGLLIKVDLKGIQILEEADHFVKVKVAAGENWHGFVQKAVRNDWGGVENLSLIPGTVGAAPIQNIGAYGVEIQSMIENVEGIDLSSGHLKVFSNDECEFGYRESVFKRGLKKKYFISSITLRLTKKSHQLNTSYGAIKDTLNEMNVTDVTIQTISEAVIKIRQSKLPDPSVVGNAGSFFKNPTIALSRYETLLQTHSSMPGYQVDNQNIKVPAGWLIEQCGWKGKTIKNVGVHPKQALVLVNYGDGSGAEILALAKQIQASVLQKFEINLTPEVNIL